LSTAWRDSRATHVPFEGSHLAIGLTRAGEPPTCTPTIEGLHRLIRGTPDAKAMSTMESLADVALGSDGSSVWLVRGGASRIRLFVDRRVAGNVRLTDRIEPSDVPLRPDFLTFAMAHAVLSPFERRATSQTVFAGVECVPPASCCRVDARGRMEVSVLDHATDEFQSANRAEALEAVRASVDAAIERAVEAGFDGRPVAFEVSGGIDSAIVAARTLAILRNGRRAAPQHAITIRYPYHEFRNEARYAKAVADALGLPVVDVKGEDCLPFDGWATDGNNTGCGDEPGLQQVGRRQHLATLAAGGHQPSLLFHGFGGDTIFGFGPVLQFVVKKPPARPDWMSSSAWNSFLNEWESVRAHFPDTASGHRRQFFSGANIDDCWADMYLAPRLRVVRAGAFTATRLLNAAARLWQLGPTDGMPQYKWILREAFRDDLPRLLYERTHKIAYDGLYVRGYRRHRDHLAALVDRGRMTLQSAGISATGVKAAIDRIAGGNLDNDLLLSMLLCSLEWIEVRGAVPPR
jgi:asparagine synthetase B (glutamine-hydrolysing)